MATSTVTDRESVPVGLSWEQRRDLAGQGLAALITSFLIVAPLALSLPGPTPHVSPVAVVTGAPVVMPALPSALPALPRRAHAPRRHDVALQVAVATPANEAEAIPARMPTRRTFGRRLANIFAGDGSVAIRPFPSVAER